MFKNVSFSELFCREELCLCAFIAQTGVIVAKLS